MNRPQTEKRWMTSTKLSSSFVQKILFGRKCYGWLDSSGCPEVHADGGLGDLQVGQTAEVLQDRQTALSAPH